MGSSEDKDTEQAADSSTVYVSKEKDFSRASLGRALPELESEI